MLLRPLVVAATHDGQQLRGQLALAFLRLAGLGGGSCELVESEDRLDDVMDKVHRRIGTPVLTGLELTGDLDILPGTMVPARLPELFAGAPLRISGRYLGNVENLRIKATDATGRPFEETVVATRSDNAALTAVWARGHIRDLEDRYQTASGSRRAAVAKEITTISLQFSVLCRFTSFVAVDRAEVEWLIKRITEDDVIHDNERALLAYIKEQAVFIDPALDPYLAKYGV